MPAEPGAAWAPLSSADLPTVLRLAAEAHPDLPERPEIFAEKQRLFPAGCLKLKSSGQTAGYGFSHPWVLNSVPALDSFLAGLPERPGCLYIHDVVVARAARGGGAAVKYLELMLCLARERKLPALALTAVYGTGALWARFGFKPVCGAGLAAQLAPYGHGAEYLVLRC